MFECSILVFESDEFLFVAFEKVDFLLEMGDDDFFLVGLDFERGVEVGGSFGTAHLMIRSIK